MLRVSSFVVCVVLVLVGCAPVPPLPATVVLPPAVTAEPEAPPVAPPPPAPTARADEEVAPEDAAREVARSIQRISATEYVITRRGEELMLGNLSTLMKNCRIDPVKQGDRVVGLRVFGVHPDETLGLLGLQNGDRIERLGGRDVSSPEHALEAYATLHKATRMVLEIERQGAPVKILYRVE